jgi:hypothetical protein
MFELGGVDHIVRPFTRVVIGRRRGLTAAEIVLRLLFLVLFPLIHLRRARAPDLVSERDPYVGILYGRSGGGRADNVDKPVIVGGRRPRGLSFDDLACRIL